jgi:C-terminal processing protease CtpA/Prc
MFPSLSWFTDLLRFPSLTLAIWAALFFPGAVLAQGPASPAPEAQRLQRLRGLAELWGEVRYRHPTLASGDIDWDAALLAALPKVEAARSREDYARALQGMLDTLGDPATHLEPWDSQARARPAPSSRPLHSWEKGDLLAINLGVVSVPGGLSPFDAAYTKLIADMKKARAVVVDMRARAFTDPRAPFRMQSALELIAPHLFQGELRTPAQRMVRRAGYRSQFGIPSGYTMEFVEGSEDVVTGEARPGPRAVVFLFDTATSIPAVALALQQQGLARIVSEGELSQGAGAERLEVKPGEGLTAWVRASEFTVPLRADVRVPERPAGDTSDAPVQAALKLARRGWKRPASVPRPEPLPRALWRPDSRYEESPYPASRALRQLAAIRVWTVIRLFHPTLELFEKDWDGALAHFLPKFEAARDAREYALAAAEMTTWIQDGHVYLRDHPEIIQLWGDFSSPVVLFDLEGKAVVVEVLVPSAAPGLQVGDVLEAIDGEPIATRLQRLAPYVTASTTEHRRFQLLRRALGGREGSTSTLTVRGADGKARQVPMTRSRDNFEKQYTERGPAFRLLPGNVGWVQLGLMRASDVPAVLEQARKARALVLDLRGYPQGVVPAMAPALNTRNAKYSHLSLWNVVEGPYKDTSFHARGPVPRADVPLYRGRTVTLIDERTISQAESAGLMLEAVNGTTFVGSPSAGANGDISDFSLPGGLTVIFSGAEIRHSDGGQLQCLGIQPQVRVRPTLEGLRAGRDEVLEAALRLLEAPAPAVGR